MLFFHLKSYFQSEFFGHVGKRLVKKAKVDFNIYNAANWEGNIHITHTAQSAFFDKNSTFTQSNTMKAVLEIFLAHFSGFVR